MGKITLVNAASYGLGKTRKQAKRKARCFVLSLLCVVLMCAPASAGPRVLTIDYPDFWPFFTRASDGEMTGFFYEIVSEAMESLGVETQWDEYSWKRCQSNVRHGLAEAMITVPTPERLEYAATHQDPFYLKTLNVFTYKEHPRLEVIRSLKTLDEIGLAELTVITYAGNGWNKKNIESRGINTLHTSYIRDSWRMLAERRGDIVIEWPFAAWAEIRKTGESADLIMQTGATFAPMPFHLMINRESPEAELLPAFNKAIIDMKKSGRIDEIVARYTRQ